MEIDLTLDPVITSKNRQIVMWLATGKKFFHKPRNVFLLIVPAAIFLIFISLATDIFTTEKGLSSVSITTWFFLAWFGYLLPDQFNVALNILFSKGKFSHKPAKTVEGYNSGPFCAKLEQDYLRLEMPLEKERIDWAAITDVFAYKNQFYFATGVSHVLTVPATDEIRLFLESKGYLG